jgi:hypothetical protein
VFCIFDGILIYIVKNKLFLKLMRIISFVLDHAQLDFIVQAQRNSPVIKIVAPLRYIILLYSG